MQSVLEVREGVDRRPADPGAACGGVAVFRSGV